MSSRDPVRIQVRIDPPHPLVCRKRRLNGVVFRMRPEKMSRCVTVKMPPCSKTLSAEHRPKFCSPSPVMVTSPYKWNILERKVQSFIPKYFKSKSTPGISYIYTPTIASKLFNYKQTLQSLDIDHLTLNPPTCSCSSSPFSYSSAGHTITGDVDMVENEDLKSLIRKGPKFREHRSFNWRQNFVSIVNAFEDYVKRWAKRENENNTSNFELDSKVNW
jgi:hypothetical protein